MAESRIAETRYVLAVPDLGRSAAFFRDVLGFEISELGDPGWRVFARDRCVIMAGERPDAFPAFDTGDHSCFAYLVVEGIDAYYQRVVTAGASVMKALRDEPWGMRKRACAPSTGAG